MADLGMGGGGGSVSRPTLGRVHTMRDLRVLIDDKLHFSDHV